MITLLQSIFSSSSDTLNKLCYKGVTDVHLILSFPLKSCRILCSTLFAISSLDLTPISQIITFPGKKTEPCKSWGELGVRGEGGHFGLKSHLSESFKKRKRVFSFVAGIGERVFRGIALKYVLDWNYQH